MDTLAGGNANVAAKRDGCPARYSCCIIDDGYYDPSCEMVEDEDGAFVEYADYVAALVERDARIAELEKPRNEGIERVRYANRRRKELEAQLTASRAECEGLRAALTECAFLSGLDNELIEGASVVVTGRMAEIHQHSSAALSQKETGDE